MKWKPVELFAKRNNYLIILSYCPRERGALWAALNVSPARLVFFTTFVQSVSVALLASIYSRETEFFPMERGRRERERERERLFGLTLFRRRRSRRVSVCMLKKRRAQEGARPSELNSKMMMSYETARRTSLTNILFTQPRERETVCGEERKSPPAQQE